MVDIVGPESVSGAEAGLVLALSWTDLSPSFAVAGDAMLLNFELRAAARSRSFLSRTFSRRLLTEMILEEVMVSAPGCR